MASSDDPLEELYVDKDEIDRERLSAALEGIIGIDKETAEPAFQDFHELNNKNKVISYLLFRRTLLALEEIEESELGVSPGYISDMTGIPKSTITAYKSTMSVLEMDEDIGGYYIPAHAINSAIEIIEE